MITFEISAEKLEILVDARLVLGPLGEVSVNGGLRIDSNGLVLHADISLDIGFGEDIGQRPLLFTGILFIVASIQFLTTGVLAELLARTFFESSDHPNFNIARQSDPDRAGWREPE